MESQYFGHEHPLAFSEDQSNHSEADQCSRCGEVMAGPSFSCAECEFYLHKKCAEAPSQIDHPFHRDHPLCLLPNPPATAAYGGSFFCHFCGEDGKMFVYHCSCDIDLHIKCALFTYDIAEKNLGELNVIDYKDPLISDENDNKELESAKCFGCRQLLLDSVYYSLDCGFNLHKKCAELPFEINYPCHYKHPLILQFSAPTLSCIICHDTNNAIGFFYCCSPCNLVIHIACMSPPPTIEDKGHQHTFTLLFRQIPFTCDACGVEGNHVPYICLNRNLLVHKKCISLPRIVKCARHEHPIFHTYFHHRYDQSKNWDCVVCHDEVNTDHGSYYCSDCHFIVHVNCVIRFPKSYYIVEPDEILHGNSALLSDISIESFTAIERNKDGEATKIKHFSHVHDLILSDKIIEDDKCCDGCTLSIMSPFYYCSDCDFFLHKICAELPKKKHFWAHLCQQLLTLVSGYNFRCRYCVYVCNGFGYKCDKCAKWICLRCIAPDTLTCEGHEHPLAFYWKYEGQCNGCGEKITQAYNCKECNFPLCMNCPILPLTIRHKCDEHLLALTYHDDNTYSKSHFCDICEEDRNPSHWFYSCAICDTSVHRECALGRYPFMKSGRIIEIENHPHSVALVKKMYYYPKCFVCGDPCRDLAVECIESGCEYIAHWECVLPSSFWEYSSAALPEK
ncbi:hypothetical protein REPUB_Repub04eG0216000 [Reevesia pubescens]